MSTRLTVEQCAVLTGVLHNGIWLLRRHSLRSGQRTSVEADWRWALRREERCGDVVGFYHTHPPGGGVRPSRRDVRTMRGWCAALGKPLLCVIACGSEVLTTRFEGQTAAGRRLPATMLFARGMLVALEEDADGDDTA